MLAIWVISFSFIGLSGVNQLEKLDIRFGVSSLFLLKHHIYAHLFIHQAHKKEQPMKLLLICPYLNLMSSQKALEWHLNHFHIHQFNSDAYIFVCCHFTTYKI